MALSTLEALILGVVQGITEWLPVSSSGHLVLAQHLMGEEVPVAFDLLLHVATLAAVLLAFRTDLWAMTKSLGQGPWSGGIAAWPADRRLALGIVIGTLPIVAIGLLFREQVEASFHSLKVTGFAFLITAALLTSTVWTKVKTDTMPPGPTRALIVGAFQVIALLPGVSRSGATIAGGQHMGLTRVDAARFSFLLAIPAFAGATVLQWGELWTLGEMGWTVLVVGFVASFVVGYSSIRFLLGFVRKHSLLPFAGYCVVAGVGTLVWAYGVAG